MIINLVLPAIHEKYPWHTQNTIIIQHDNASSHTRNDDPAILQAIAELNLPVEFKPQPPNSPDLNICDLSFFRSLQSQQVKQTPTRTSVELIDSVTQAFDVYAPYKLRYSFLTLQGCMNCIIAHGGNNDYKIPHMGKHRLDREGRLPETIRAIVNIANDNNENIDNNNNDYIEYNNEIHEYNL